MGLTPFVDLYPKRKEKQDFSGLYSKLLGLPLEGAIAFYPKTQIICYIAALKVSTTNRIWQGYSAWLFSVIFSSDDR